jgi:hypothetical protein
MIGRASAQMALHGRGWTDNIAKASYGILY